MQLTLLDEALVLTNDREERRWEAELYRLKGEFLLVHSAAHHAEAETCFRQALDVARHQQATCIGCVAHMCPYGYKASPHVPPEGRSDLDSAPVFLLPPLIGRGRCGVP
jgi:hypothetical protein